MNRIHIQMTALAALLVLAGCAKESENPTDSSDSAAIELSSVSTDPMTKAVITGTEFTTSEAEAGFGLFLLDGSGATYGSNSCNVRYGYRDGKCSFATVAGRKGWVIAPDNYTGTLKEKYDAAEWPSAEEDGLVFLPFAGQRMTADEMGDFETQGCYWSASLFLEDEEDASCADYWGFTPEGILPDNTWRESGYAIRLVKEYSASVPTTGKAKAATGRSEVDVKWIQLRENGPKLL